MFNLRKRELEYILLKAIRSTFVCDDCHIANSMASPILANSIAA